MPHLLIIASGMITYAGIRWYQRSKINKASNAENPNAPKQQVINDNQQLSETNYAINTVHQDFTVASLSFGLATAGSFFYYPLLNFISMFGVSYNTTPIWHKGYNALVEQKQVNGPVTYSILVGSFLLTNHFFMAALINWLFYLSKRFLFIFKDSIQKGLVGFLVATEPPDSVWLMKDGIEIEASVDSLKAGDIIVVNAGKMIPVDGLITEGNALIDQTLLTGATDASPLEKKAGAHVFAFTYVLSGQIYIKVKKWGKETYAAKMAEMYS
jgi:cation transport ATPase